MLVDIILLILVILVLYKIYINKLKKEHMLSNEDVYMYSKNESRLLGNYYNMINNPSISNREKCINNDKVIAEFTSNPTISPKILNLARKFKEEECKVIKNKDIQSSNSMHVLGDDNPIKSGKYEYSLKDNMNNEPKLIRVDTTNPLGKPYESNASLIIKISDDVYAYNMQNSKWYQDKNNSWNMVVDNATLAKLHLFVNEFLVLRTSLNKKGTKLVNSVPIFHINNDIFPIKKQILNNLYEFSIINGKLQISNITKKEIESNDQNALVLLLLNDNLYVLNKAYNWMIINNNKLIFINDNSVINQLNNVYNNMIKRKTLIKNIETPVMFKYDNLYYTTLDSIPLEIKNREINLYTIDNSKNFIIKSNKNSDNNNNLKLEFITIISYDNKIYFKTKTGSWVSDKSIDNTIKLEPITDEESRKIDQQLLFYMTEKLEAKNSYYKEGDKTPYTYNGSEITLQNGLVIKDIDGLLYVKFHNQEFLKFIKINRYDIVQPDKLAIIKPRLLNLIKRFENFRNINISVHNQGDTNPITHNSFVYKINNKNELVKNNVPFQPIFSILLNLKNSLYAKTIDGNWYKEKNESLTPEYKKVYESLNMDLVKAISLRNVGLQLNTKQQVPNLQSCSKSTDCFNNNAYCRMGNNLCMYDDECNFMYRDKNSEQRTEFCRKMPKNIEWYSLKKDSPILMNTLVKDRIATKLPNSIFDSNNIQICPSNSLNNTNGCVFVTGMHNVYILLNNLKYIVSTSIDRENIPGYAIIKKEGEEKYRVNVFNWPSKSPLSDVMDRTEIYKSIKDKSFDNINIENNTVELMLLNI
jgi:hypothetical protein